MTPRRRLTAEQRRADLVAVAAEAFAERAYDQVQMDDLAERAGISRALLYRHFPSKKDLFAAVYQEAAASLATQSPIDPKEPIAAQVVAGLDAHIDYFVANRNTVLAANRALGGDPTIQAIISGELRVLRQRLLDAVDHDRSTLGREALSSVLMAWLVFVQVLCVDWLEAETMSRVELRDACLGALLGVLGPPS